MSMRVSSWMDCIMGRENWPLLKDCILVTFGKENSMDMGSLSGIINLFIEVFIIWVEGKDKVSILMLEIRVSQEGFGRMGNSVGKVSILNLKVNNINAFGRTEK